MSMLVGSWPSAVAVADFGIDSQKHYEALSHPIREAEIMPQALDAAIGDGEKLTALTRNAASNPYPDVTFRTSRDRHATPGSTARSAFREVLDRSSKSSIQENGRHEERTVERERA